MTKEEAKTSILYFADLQNKRTELLRSICIEENVEKRAVLEYELKNVCKDIDYLLENALQKLGW